MLKYALLGSLSYQPMTGYDLKQYMDTTTANFWHAKLSQIYVTLKALEQEGLVASDVQEQASRPDRRVYTVTPQGAEALQQWLTNTNTEPLQLKDSFLLKLFFSARVDKGTLLTHLKIQRDAHQKLLNQHCTETKTKLQQISDQVPQLRKDVLFWEATRRSGELIEEAMLQWLDETIEMVQREL